MYDVQKTAFSVLLENVIDFSTFENNNEIIKIRIFISILMLYDD